MHHPARSHRSLQGSPGLAAPVVSNPDSVVAHVTGAKIDGSSGRVDFNVRVDSYAFYCQPLWLVLGGSQSGDVFGVTYFESSMGLDCSGNVSMPVSGLTGEDVVLAIFPGTIPREELERKAWPMAETIEVSDPFELVGTQEGRNSGLYEEPDRSILPDDAGFTAGLDSIEGIVQWGTVLVGGAAALWFGYPLVMAGREALEDATDSN